MRHELIIINAALLYCGRVVKNTFGYNVIRLYISEYIMPFHQRWIWLNFFKFIREITLYSKNKYCKISKLYGEIPASFQKISREFVKFHREIAAIFQNFTAKIRQILLRLNRVFDQNNEVRVIHSEHK